jgi:acyl-CoA thioester hydrolase
MFRHETNIRVRYAETDQMGYVYYGNYAAYYEIARTESIRSLGITYKSLEEKGIWLPVSSMEMKFLRPAFYDDLLIVETEIRELPNTEIIFHTIIKNETGKILNSGRIKLSFWNAEEKKVVQAPSHFLELLKPYFPAE